MTGTCLQRPWYGTQHANCGGISKTPAAEGAKHRQTMQNLLHTMHMAHLRRIRRYIRDAAPETPHAWVQAHMTASLRRPVSVPSKHHHGTVSMSQPRPTAPTAISRPAPVRQVQTQPAAPPPGKDHRPWPVKQASSSCSQQIVVSVLKKKEENKSLVKASLSKASRTSDPACAPSHNMQPS